MNTVPELTWKTVVCLANSRKLSGRCIAGVEVDRGQRVGWIRPVSDREHREVSEHERRYEDGTDPVVLDVIKIPLLEPRPYGYQSENWLLEPSYYWEKEKRRLTWAELPALEDVGRLWLEGSSSTYNGINDRVSVEVAAGIRDSLRLIHVFDLELRVFAPGRDFGNPKRRVQAAFTHLGTEYRVFVTDPVVERKYLALANDNYTIGDAYLTVSLGEPYDGDVYKLVAAVITEARAS